MIWTDADFVTQDDLLSVDPDLANVGAAQKITITGNNGTIRRGIENAGRTLEAALISFATYISSNDLSANHLAAVFYTGSQPNQRRRVTLEQIVISGRTIPDLYWSEIKQWVVNKCLIEFYVSASNRAQSDRYMAKLEQFRLRDVQECWPLFKQSGTPITYRPMPVPGATQARAPGSWLAGVAAVVSATGGSFDVAVTYVDSSKYVSPVMKQNGESGPSAVQTVTPTANQGITVDITALNPPMGAVGLDNIARGFTVPLNASNWNVYVGVSGGTLFLQNTSLLPISQKTYALASDPVLSGYATDTGQYPEAFLSMQDLINRG